MRVNPIVFHMSTNAWNKYWEQRICNIRQRICHTYIWKQSFASRPTFWWIFTRCYPKRNLICVSALLRHPRTPTTAHLCCAHLALNVLVRLATKHSLRIQDRPRNVFNSSTGPQQSIDVRYAESLARNTNHFHWDHTLKSNDHCAVLWLDWLPICVREQRRPKNDSLPCRLAAINCRCLLSIGVVGGGSDDTLYSKVSTTHQGEVYKVLNSAE